MAELVILDDAKVRQLASVIYFQEFNAIQNIKFGSEFEQAQYLRDSRANLDTAVKLLDDGAAIKSKFKDDRTRSSIADDVFDYVVYCANNALQTVPNYTLRMSYLEKINEHVKELIDDLEDLDVGSVSNVEALAEEAHKYKNAMLEYTRKYHSIASRNFSTWVKDSGMTFEELVVRYKSQLQVRDRSFEKSFKDLEDKQKIEVYEEIMQASGRGRVVDVSRGFFTIGGIAVLLFSAGMMAWDIYSAEHKLEAALYGVVTEAASNGGEKLVKIITSAVSSGVVIGVKATVAFMTMAGMIISLGGAFILGAFAGWLIGFIFSSGGSMPVLSTDDHHSYVSPMPDGQTLARQLSHQ